MKTRNCITCAKEFTPANPAQYYCKDLCRFESKFDKGAVNECWIWKFGKDSDGYGNFWRLSVGDSVRAHRFSYESYVGPIPPGLVICHTCDNPSCVNPNHLFPGTSLENTVDAKLKGRMCKGSRCHSALLTEETALEAKSYLSQGCRGADIAAFLGVSKSTIYKLKNGKSWKHVI